MQQKQDKVAGMKRWFWLVFMSILIVGCTVQTTVEQTVVPLTVSTQIANATDIPATIALGATTVPASTATPLAQFTAPPLPTAVLPQPTVPPAATNVRRGEDEDYNFRQWATFDGIPPIYEPYFALAGDAPLQDDELVMGITLGGEAKAYPITVLQFREMVNDELAGIPILVSW